MTVEVGQKEDTRNVKLSALALRAKMGIRQGTCGIWYFCCKLYMPLLLSDLSVSLSLSHHLRTCLYRTCFVFVRSGSPQRLSGICIAASGSAGLDMLWSRPGKPLSAPKQEAPLWHLPRMQKNAPASPGHKGAMSIPKEMSAAYMTTWERAGHGWY